MKEERGVKVAGLVGRGQGWLWMDLDNSTPPPHLP